MPLPLRIAGKQMWVKNPTADVAAIYIGLPTEITPIVSTLLLADDDFLTANEVHPGEDLNVLGYPLGYGGPGGFPVLRSGKIASYPLVPVKNNPFFLLDFRVFQGNSGGPVYMVSSGRIYGGIVHADGIQGVFGLVSEELSATEELHGLYESRAEKYPLSLAKIVPAAFIKDTLELLPPPTAD